MRSLLWVTAIAPCFDARGGGEIRQAQLLDALADRFDVRLLLVGTTLRDPRIRARVSAVTELPGQPAGDPRSRTRRRLRELYWQLVLRQPDEVARQRGLRAVLRPTLEALPPHDVVCVEYVGLAPAMPARRAGTWALTLHNLPSEMARHSAQIAQGRRQRAMIALERRNARRVERRAAGAYDVVVAVSDDDARCLSPGAVVVPNGVDTERFVPAPLPGAHRVIFTGALHTRPNRDGIQWLCRDVWPLVRARLPDATLSIVGSAPPADVLQLVALDGVEVHADVPDVVPHLQGARVAVVPLRIGSGSRLKALEAMAAGRPVVGTRIGLGGLDVASGREAVVADERRSFAEAVVRLLDDDSFAAELAQRGRRLALERYAWSRIGADYATLLETRASS